MDLDRKILVVIAHGFRHPSGPSITLLHLLQGISRNFNYIYIVSTIDKGFTPQGYRWYDKFLPSNTKILYTPRTKSPQTLTYGWNRHAIMQLGETLKRIITKIYQRHFSHSSYLYVASDVFNLRSLGEVFNTRFLVGYNIFFNFAPIELLLKNFSIRDMITMEFLKNSLFSLLTTRIELYAVKFINKIMAHTMFQKKMYMKYRGVDETDIIVFPHLINMDLIRNLAYNNNFEMNEQIIFRKKTFTAIYVGRLVREKGVHVLLKAYSLAIKKGCNGILIIVGKGPLQPLVLKYRKNLGNSLIFLGEKEYPGTLKLISLSDVLILPSLNESFGFVLLEAMSLGKLVIASKVGGIPELVRPSCGVLVNPGDVKALAEVIQQMCDRGLRDENFANKCINSFDTKVKAGEFVRIVEKYGEFSIETISR